MTPTRTIRGGRGLGDALYVRPIAELFVKRKERVIVYSDYHEVFIGAGVEVLPFVRMTATTIAHYVSRKGVDGTTQWQDVCLSAGVSTDLPLRFGWKIRNSNLVDDLRQKSRGRPIIMVHGGRKPMNRNDGFGIEMLPDQRAFQLVLGELEDCFLVQVGKMEQLYPLSTELSLLGKTTVSDLLDIASACDGVVAQCSFAVPLAEVFAKPLLAIWSRKGLGSRERFISTVTPSKLLCAATDRWVLDNEEPEALRSAARVWSRYLDLDRSWRLRQCDGGLR